MTAPPRALAENHYLMTTTTANAAKVMQHLELCRQWLFAPLNVQIVSVTDQWAQLAVAGPRARDVLRAVVDPEHDISNAALPYMGAATLSICGGLAARLFRLSFSGELAYELAVPAHYGAALAARLMEAGAPHGIVPYGTEALGVMRIEKGHPAGNELNGQTTAPDLGFAKLLSKRKDFVGRTMAARPALTDPARPTLGGAAPGRSGGPATGRRPPAAARRPRHRRQRPRPRHLGLLLADARPLDRARPAEKTARPGTARSSASTIRSATAIC